MELLTAQQARALVDLCSVIEKDKNTMLEDITNKIRNMSLKGEKYLLYYDHSIGDYQISQKNIEVRDKVIKTLSHLGYIVITTGLNMTSNPYIKIEW